MKMNIILFLLLPFLCSCSTDEITEESYFSIEESSLSQQFTQDKTTVEIGVKTNLNQDQWDVESDSDWCLVAKSLSSSGTSFNLSVTASEEADVRKSTVTLTSTVATIKIQVDQLGYGPAILVKNSSSVFSHTGGELGIEVLSNIDYQLQESNLADWIEKSPSVKGFTEYNHAFFVSENKSYLDRSSIILFKGTEHTNVEAEYEVKQQAIPSNPSDVDVEGDIMLKVTGGEASEFQPGYNIEKSFDGELGDTHYHSRWYDATELPVTLEYFFEGSDDLDYLIYHSRSGNGNFGEFELFVLSADEGGYRKVGDYDFGMKNGSQKLVLPETVTRIEKVKFSVKSGAGGYVSCDEMEFYRKNNDKKLDEELLKVFTDLTCSALKANVTDEQIMALPAYFGRIATLLKTGLYDSFEKEFRVRSYEPYSHVEQWAQKLMTKKYSDLDNPVGIYANKGDTLIVLVGETHGNSIAIMSIQESMNGDYMQIPTNGITYNLEEGVNKVPVTQDGDLFFMYTAHPQEKPIRVHIPPGSGTVNGFFDLKEHKTDARYAELLRSATHKYFMVRGEKIMFYFHRLKLLEFVPNEILSAINLWDNIIGWQQELMGINDVRPQDVNNHILAISPEGSYMWASDYRVGFVYTYLNNILLYDNVMAAKDNAWGPAHEIGHVHQWAINWPGSTESSNNLFSNYILYKLGKYTSRGTELCLPEPDDNMAKNTLTYIRCVLNRPWADFGSGHQNENTELHMRMNWQLWMYYHRCGHNPDFWPTLFKLMRDNRLETVESAQDPGAKQLLFARIASQAAQEDLSEFFERWGFFVPVDMSIEQYGTWRYRVTQTMIDETKRFMSKYPKARPFYYIEDRKKGDEGLDNMPPDVGYYTQFSGSGSKITKTITYSRTGRTFKIANGDEAVGFEIRRGSEIVYFSTFFEFTVPDTISLEGVTVQAVQADGTRVTLR